VRLINHLDDENGILVKSEPLLKIIQKPWKSYLNDDVQNDEIELFRKHERTGRPIESLSFIETLEQLLDRNLKPQKPGPKVVDGYSIMKFGVPGICINQI
jgi:putative transposase